MSQAEDDLEVARAALQAFDEKRTKVTDDLKAESAVVNQAYQAAESAVIAEQPEPEAPAQEIGA